MRPVIKANIKTLRRDTASRLGKAASGSSGSRFLMDRRPASAGLPTSHSPQKPSEPERVGGNIISLAFPSGRGHKHALTTLLTSLEPAQPPTWVVQPGLSNLAARIPALPIASAAAQAGPTVRHARQEEPQGDPPTPPTATAGPSNREREGQPQEADEQVHAEPDRQPDPASSRPKESSTGPLSYMADVWRKNVGVAVELSAARDHLAVERTFLAYLRTSLMMAMIGTLLAQLFSLQQKDSGFGYSLVGKPLTSVCFAFAIVTAVLGATRSWRLQQAILAGKALAGGPEIMTMAIAFVALVVVFFSFLLAIDINKEYSYK